MSAARLKIGITQYGGASDAFSLEKMQKRTALEAQYQATDRGTVIDKLLGLEWTSGDNRSDLDWQGAQA